MMELHGEVRTRTWLTNRDRAAAALRKSARLRNLSVLRPLFANFQLPASIYSQSIDSLARYVELRREPCRLLGSAK